MTNEIFPHPHDDESAEDPFTGPADPFSDQSLGASPMNPVAAARQPKRRLAIFAIAGSVTLLALFFFFSSRGGDEAVEAVITTGQVDVPAQAERATQPNAEDIEALTPPTTTLPSSSQPSGSDLLDPSSLGQPVGSVDPMLQDPYGPSPIPPGGVQMPGGAPVIPDPSAAPEYSAGYGYVEPQQPTDRPGVMTEADYDRQALLDAQREAAEAARAEAEARAAAIKAEEERLRGAPTVVAEANDLAMDGGRAAAPGTSRFGLDTPAPAAGSDSDQIAQAGVAQAGEIIPGTRVTATLTSEFISDAQGAGRVEARLNEPLRSNGRVILPAGTRAYGTASASVPSTAQEARVAVQFNIFVTPSGEVVRDLSGHAADPETLAMSVPGKVDNRYLERIARGALSTAVDLALTRGADDRRSAFEQPSARDMAIQDARMRAGAIINGQVGDEGSVAPAVKLEQGTKLVLIFGF